MVSSYTFDSVPRRIKDQSIVIVEDDPYICESLSIFLGEQNTVKTFPSAEEAMAAEGEFEDVKVFILDYKLPGKDGINPGQQVVSNVLQLEATLEAQ